MSNCLIKEVASHITLYGPHGDAILLEGVNAISMLMLVPYTYIIYTRTDMASDEKYGGHLERIHRRLHGSR